MQVTANPSRLKRNIIDTTKKISTVRSDIFFFSKSKQINVIPKGLNHQESVSKYVQYLLQSKIMQRS